MDFRTPKRLRRVALMVTIAAAALAAGSVGSASATQAEYDQGYALGLDAYKYGLPLVTMNKTYANQTSINVSNGKGFGPPNRFNPVRQFAQPDDRSVVAPNYDTLYSIAWLNLNRQPQIIHVPHIKHRYFVIPMLDPFTEDFKNLGSVNKTKPGNYAVVGPRQANIRLPKGVRRIKSKYNRVWVIERIYADNSDQSDFKKVHKYQNRIRVTPLSAFGHKHWKPKPPRHRDTTVNDPGIPQGLSYFDKLGGLLQHNKPPAADQNELDKLSAIGVGPGLTPSENTSLSADTKAGMVAAVAAGPASITSDVTAQYAAGFAAHNGYFISATGSYGTDYKFRAEVTQVGLGAMLPNQAVYPLAQVDHSFSPLTGAKNYKLHIAAGQLPPVNAFWSLTLYDLSGFLVPNSINRYVINDRSDLHYNADGSVDLYIQPTQPADAGQAQNWLPSPADTRFRLIWRLYDTKADQLQGVLDGVPGWTPPAINAVP